MQFGVLNLSALFPLVLFQRAVMVPSRINLFFFVRWPVWHGP